MLIAINVRRNINTSFIISILFHIFLYSSYIYLKQSTPEDLIMLENVEIIEIEPDAPMPPPQVMPAQRPPKNVLDFIKMALPALKKQELKEISEPETEEIIKTPKQEKIDLKKTMELRSKPDIKLDEKPIFKQNTKLNEILPEKEIDNTNVLAQLAQDEPAIEISEVGRKAVKTVPTAPTINFNKKAAPTLKETQDLKITQKPSTYRPQMLKEGTVTMGKRRVKKTTGYNRKASIGYSKGIKLKKYVRKPAKDIAKIPSTITSKASKSSQQRVKEVRPTKKSVEIVGPVTKRKVLRSFLPVYPDWAKAKHIEADVVIRFFVTPNGKVREKIYLERTSGYGKLDQLAIEAIRQWMFEAIATSTGDQWGVITFRYLLE